MSLHDTPASDLRLVDETALENGDPCLSTKQLDPDNGYSHKLLRRMAAEANTNEINGKSTSLAIKSYFHCQRSLTDYE